MIIEIFLPLIEKAHSTSISYAIAPLIPLAIAGATELFKIGHAANRKRKAEEGLADLQNQPYPTYQTGEQIYDRANAKATGLTAEEKANAIHQLNQLATKRYNTAIQTAPNQASAINAGINYGSIQGQLGLVAEDARKRREDLQRLIGLVGNQSNLQTGADIRKRVSEEQAYGKAISDNDLNMVQSVEGLGSMAANYGFQQNYLNGLNKAGVSPTTVPYGQTTGGAGLRAQYGQDTGFTEDNIPAYNPNFDPYLFGKPKKLKY